MTLDEAIEHLDDSLQDKNHKWSCKGCRREHEQLRDWLEELKLRRIAHYECKDALVTACMDFKDRIKSALDQFNYENEVVIRGKEMIDLNKLCEVSLKNADERHSHGANIDMEARKILRHCATEVVEAAEEYAKFCFSAYGSKERFVSELADIICCCLIIAGKEKIDIEKAILDCIEKNRKRSEGSGDKP